MANTKSYSLGPGLSTAETVAGYCYLPFYVVLLAMLIEFVSGYFHLGLSTLQINICYFVINTIVVWIIFHNFLLRSLRGTRFWELVQALILGFVLYYAGNYVLSLALHLLRITVATYNDDTVQALASENCAVMVVCSVSERRLIYSRLWMRPESATLSPTLRFCTKRAFLPHAMQGM